MEYGKFASAEELLKSYKELEKSFTQKCQQLANSEREIEELRKNQRETEINANGGINAEASPQTETHSTTVDSADTAPQQTASDVNVDLHGPASSEKNNDESMQQYSNEPNEDSRLLQPKSNLVPDVMTGGGNVSMALPSRPKTIKEASLMAKELFKMG